MYTWRRWSMAVATMAALLCSTVSGFAEEPSSQPTEVSSTDSATHTVELGANIRTDLGVRALRVDAAYATPSFRLLGVVDPMFWTDGRTVTDVIGFWRPSRLEPFGGWRLHTVPLLDGSQLQHHLVVGAAIGFPEFFDGRLGGQWGIEMATMIVKHGGGVAGDWFRTDSPRHYLDRVTLGMFARFHYNLEL